MELTPRQRSILTDHRNELCELVATSEQNFEKQLSYIAGGGLALSFVFIEKVIGSLPDSIWPLLLYIGWFSLAVCLVANLYSQKIATEVHSSNKAEIERTLMLEDGQEWDKDCYNPNRCERRRRKVIIWNNASLWLLSAGISCVLIFAVINIKSQTEKERNRDSVVNLKRTP